MSPTRLRIPVIAATMALPLLLASCYKTYDLETADYDVVVTDYDPEADFQSKVTYSLPEHITIVEEPDNPNPPDPIDPAVEAIIFNRIESNMNAYGYTRELDPVNSPPDVSVLVAAAKRDYYYYYDDCWWYWGYYYCWYYPPASGGGYYEYAFTAGSLFIQLGDSTDVTPGVQDNVVPVLWFAAINGILNDTQANLQQRIENRIDQAFSQSLYLDRN